jgi:endonuclease YncB( thermonuclease family)
MTKIFSSVLLLITLSCKGYANSFSAEYIRNYDGDTITLDLDCKIDYFCNNRSIRIYGIDTPEIRTKNKCEKRMGVLAKLFVKDKLHNAKNITIHNCIRGKYYREVCKVKYDGNDLGEELMAAGLAYPYYGKKKQKVNWCK